MEYWKCGEENIEKKTKTEENILEINRSVE